MDYRHCGFKIWQDIDSEKVWLSRPFTDSDWPVYFVIRLRYNDYHSEELARDIGQYSVDILAVSPEAVSPEEKLSALRYCGQETADDVNTDMIIHCLLSYGTYATLWQDSGNNQDKLIRTARAKMPELSMLFGFAMDRPQNAIGSTGWDFITGDILRPIREFRADRPDIGNEMQAMVTMATEDTEQA